MLSRQKQYRVLYFIRSLPLILKYDYPVSLEYLYYQLQFRFNKGAASKGNKVRNALHPHRCISVFDSYIDLNLQDFVHFQKANIIAPSAQG